MYVENFWSTFVSLIDLDKHDHNNTPECQSDAQWFDQLTLNGEHSCNEGAQARLNALRMAKRIMMGVGSQKV